MKEITLKEKKEALDKLDYEYNDIGSCSYHNQKDYDMALKRINKYPAINEEKTCQASLEDLKQSDLKHYEEVSISAHHWSSGVEKAINFYWDYQIKKRDKKWWQFWI